MDFIQLTEQELLNAKTYLPTHRKIELIQYVAPKCIDKVEIHGAEGVPPMFKVNPVRRNRYLMGIFAREYIGKTYEPVEKDEWLMAADDFDRYAGGHIFNQIDRMKKKNGEIRDKAFDILEDYGNLKRILYSELDSMVSIMNDPVHRIKAISAFDTSPESLKQAAEELDKLKTELQEYAKKHSDGDAGE